MRVLGTPKPSVQWYKDDVEIFSCERIEIKEEEEGGAVILKGMKFSLWKEMSLKVWIVYD